MYKKDTAQDYNHGVAVPSQDAGCLVKDEQGMLMRLVRPPRHRQRTRWDYPGTEIVEWYRNCCSCGTTGSVQDGNTYIQVHKLLETVEQAYISKLYVHWAAVWNKQHTDTRTVSNRYERCYTLNYTLD
jgi:hypothetical protein